MRQARPKAFEVGVFLILFVSLAIVAQGAKKNGNAQFYHDSTVRGPIRPVDLSPLRKEVSSEIVAGPASGLETAFLIYTRMPAGSHGPAMYTLPVDHTYLVLAGKMNIELGTDKFVAGPDTLVLVHAGVPHETWNDGSDQVTVVEVVTPAPARDLLSLMKPAEPRKIENAAQYVRYVAPPTTLVKGLNSQRYADRKSDSQNVAERIDNVMPGSGGPALHVHPFDQIYFDFAGGMKIQYGLDTYSVKANSFVIVSTGVIHTNWNDGTGNERHITLLLHEPEKQPFDIPVELKPNAGPPPAQ